MSNYLNRHNLIGGSWHLHSLQSGRGPPGVIDFRNDQNQYQPLNQHPNLGQHPSQNPSNLGQGLPQTHTLTHNVTTLGLPSNLGLPNLTLGLNLLPIQPPGFRNPWYSSAAPQVSGSGGQLPTKSSLLSPQMGAGGGAGPSSTSVSASASSRRMLMLPTTYEDDQRRASISSGPVHPPTRADNPFHYYSQEVSLHSGDNLGASNALGTVDNALNMQQNDLRRMLAAAFPYHHTYSNSNTATQLSRRQLVAVGGSVNLQYDRRLLPTNPSSAPRAPRAAPKANRINSRYDLRPRHNPQPKYRRCSVNSIHISPVNALSIYLTESYGICQPRRFQYLKLTNPKRVLTKPLEPKFNNGYDNEDSDYILYVNDILGTEEGRKYIVLDLLGCGTFGQVVKCQNLLNQLLVAVKVIKSKPAYMNQLLTEVRLLEFLNANSDGTSFIRLLDTFIHKEHLCLVFELLALNLYELIKQNQFQGLNMRLVKLLTRQLLELLSQLKGFQMIHCDLKPENILLCQPDKPDIKVIDFGLACFTRQTTYTYIQLRFYRLPEVILGLPYTELIDMWLLGCIVGELFLGLPLFPGNSEYNQIWKIVDMLGSPPRHMLELGRNSTNFFVKSMGPDMKPVYRIKELDEYVEFINEQRNKNDNLKTEKPNKKYFKQQLLKDIIMSYKLPMKKMTNTMIEKEWEDRALLLDFLTKVLNMNPLERLTPQEALKHPFVNEGRGKLY